VLPADFGETLSANPYFPVIDTKHAMSFDCSGMKLTLAMLSLLALLPAYGQQHRQSVAIKESPANFVTPKQPVSLSNGPLPRGGQTNTGWVVHYKWEEDKEWRSLTNSIGQCRVIISTKEADQKRLAARLAQSVGISKVEQDPQYQANQKVISNANQTMNMLVAKRESMEDNYKKLFPTDYVKRY
jgi:hypothetical protein